MLSGHQTFAPNAIISMPPSVQLPRGLLDHVTAVSYSGGNTVLSLTAASIYEVAPNFQFDIPLQEPGATAADFSAGADCGLPAGLSPYRHIKDVSFSGGWSTVDVFGVHVTDGVRASVHFTVEAGLEVTAGAGLSCSLSLAFNASGMAGPIPVTAGIEGDLSGSAGVGGVLKSGGSIEVSAGGHTVGFPPAMALIPDVSFDNPHFTMTAKQFAQATAGIGVTVKAGVGVGGAASLTLNVGSSLNFTAQPGSCLWNAKFGQFSADGELLKWHLSTPQTPALFTKQLGGNFCATSGSGGGGSGSGGSGGGGSTPPGGGSSPPGGGGGGGGGSGGGGAGSDNQALGAGAGHTCLVLTSGSVDCWGSNAGGTLGDGSLTGPEECVLVGEGSPCSLKPIAVSSLSKATQIAIGDPQSCAVLLSGGVDCWPELNNATPNAVAGVAGATQVAVGSAFACALLTSGEIECWGDNSLGQLGDGTLTQQASPALVLGIRDATQVVAGGEQACALLKGGQVDCWGGDLTGELGYTPSSSGCSWACSTNPTPVPSVTDAVQISAGEGETCAVVSGGIIKCWGENVYGQLGAGYQTSGPETCSVQYYGGYPCSATPVEVSGITDATRVSAGGQTVCATLATGAVECWGFSEDGGLGDGSTTGADVCKEQVGEPKLCATTPVRVSDITNASGVAANNAHACALLTTGAVECWGWNVWGQLGNGTVEASDVPVSVDGIP
jgi:alpha-tubulin suppressor-like RCC1 family protein